MNPYPLIFAPLFKGRVWGGRRLASRLRKKTPEGPIGESWELADLEDDQTVVAVGPQKGKTLSQMVGLWGGDLLGRAALVDGRFPLLLKFLDAAQSLSVQVHPSPAIAERLRGNVRLKNEAWYVIDAAPSSWILRGVKPGVDASALKEALNAGQVESILQRIPLRAGRAFYIPSGTIHALGPGALVAEIQTPSDTTYRLYDWDRTDPQTGLPRQLHIEEALDSVVLDPVPEKAEHPEHLASVWTTITSLVRCESFVVERVRMVVGVEQPIPYDEMVVWMVLNGRGSITCEGTSEPIRFGVGDTVLLPAALRNARVAIEEATTWLEVSLPVASSLGDLDRAERSSLRSDPRRTFVPLNIKPKADG